MNRQVNDNQWRSQWVSVGVEGVPLVYNMWGNSTSRMRSGLFSSSLQISNLCPGTTENQRGSFPTEPEDCNFLLICRSGKFATLASSLHYVLPSISSATLRVSDMISFCLSPICTRVTRRKTPRRFNGLFLSFTWAGLSIANYGRCALSGHWWDGEPGRAGLHRPDSWLLAPSSWFLVPAMVSYSYKVGLYIWGFRDDPHTSSGFC